MSIEFLRRLPLFAGVAEDDLESLYKEAELITVPAEQVLIQEGTPGDAMYVLLEGELQVTKRSGAHDVKIDVRRPGEVIGEMSLLDNSPRAATVRTLKDSQLLMLSKDVFERVLLNSPAAVLAILHTVTARLRQNEALLHEREKLAGLGNLAAGLAHELNNPAAAVRRAADQLRDMLLDWQRSMSELDALELNEHQAEHVNQLRAGMAQRAEAPPSLDPLTRSDRESEVEQWLDEHGVEEPWELAPTLVAFGWEPSDFEHLAEHFSPQQMRVLAKSLGIGSAVYALLDEVAKGSARISELVKAIKSYTYLDRAPVQEVNLHEGLDNTLVIMRHKLKTGIQVIREYDPDLPRIEAFAGELNQVWTNIIDNAADALGGQGEIRLRTFSDEECVFVQIIDNGPGIPPEVRKRLFEPFFTTKPPGVGTGLGLNIAYNIIHKHYGEITVDSRPGWTCFQIRLPIRLARSE